MDRLSSSAPHAGLAMGLIFFVVGLTTGNFGITGLVVVMLAGFCARQSET